MDLISQQCQAESVGTSNQLITTLITTLVTLNCNISSPEKWPADYGPIALENGLQSYDFVVIGSGSAGAVVASRLSENPNYNVLLLEAGGNPPIESEIPGLSRNMLNTEYDWSYGTISNGRSCLGRANYSCPWPRGKLLGGSSAINGMLYVRGNPLDYNKWYEQGNPTWEYENVLQYFKKAENFQGPNIYNLHGTDGPQSVQPFPNPKDIDLVILKASQELGYEQVADFVDGPYVGFGFLYGTVKDGRRDSTAKAYLRVERKNLHVIKHAIATKINFDGNNTVQSVSFVYNGTNELEVQVDKEVILSAGAIESPKLLMLSGIGARSELEQLNISVVSDLPVGENLQDHPAVSLFIKLDKKNTDLLDDVYAEWAHRNGPLSNSMLDVGAFVDTKDRKGEYPNIQCNYITIRNVTSIKNSFISPIQESIERLFDNDNVIILALVSLLNPKSRGNLTLKSADYRDKPLIYPNTFAEEIDLEIVIAGTNLQFDFESTDSFKQVKAKIARLDLPECDTFTYQSFEYWQCYAKYMIESDYHPVGTVKMGPDSDTTAVVDSELRVRGVQGLRVIDASIMPTIVSGNTNAPTIMIGEKGADFVKNSWN